MTRSTLLLCCLAFATTAACTPAQKGDSAEDLASFAHDGLPDGVKNPTRVDFGSKIELVGYDVSPEGVARPGTSLHVTLYWQRSGDLDPGWGLFTHLEDDLGRQIGNFDREGAFRSALSGKPSGLARLELGKVYTDEQNVPVPKEDLLTPNITLVAGVWNDSMRLPIVSGPTDGHDAAIIAHFATGVPRRTAALVSNK
ncbi:MAG TPA: hypothetical protein VHC69_07055 [Polyangiaceae bacterium]|nr:hypothetical protein [Polyangiaceae bacterium]